LLRQKSLKSENHMQKEELNLNSVIKEAVSFHGHLGPFLVLGVRMGLIGLRELCVKKGNSKLRVTAILERTVPFSCAIDGIQVATGCTVGNGRLKLKNTKNIIASEFRLDGKENVIVTLKPMKFKELQKALPKDVHSYKNIQLARTIASSPEEELFTIKKK
jgi:formylmethanofuran dehydrogenase subunit E